MDDNTATKTWALTQEPANAISRKNAALRKREEIATRKATKQREKKVETVYYHPPPIEPEEANFRHAHWKAERTAVRQYMQEAGTSANVLENFNNCGADAWVFYCKETQKYRLEANYCKNRNCRPCMQAKANLLATNLRTKVEDAPGKQYRFITLTLLHTSQPLATQLERLTTCFKKLRNSKIWKETQDGGAVMLEVKFNRETGEWHPHLHIVAEGYFLHHAKLSEAWYSITGDSFRVDIRALKSARDAAFYVGKYVAKGTNDDVWMTPHAAVEWIKAMKGKRICATYGTWRGFKLLEKPELTGEWTRIDCITSIERRAAAGQQDAIRLLDTLRNDLQYNPHKKRSKPQAPQPPVDT